MKGGGDKRGRNRGARKRRKTWESIIFTFKQNRPSGSPVSWVSLMRYTHKANRWIQELENI